jgi:hypothetical protein
VADYAIRATFPGLVVRHRVRPRWLGLQHLDMFLPQVGIALEHQGDQHRRPVAHFGGPAAFHKTLERDARKRRLCADHGVILLSVWPEDAMADVLAKVRGLVHRSVARP